MQNSGVDIQGLKEHIFQKQYLQIEAHRQPLKRGIHWEKK